MSLDITVTQWINSFAGQNVVLDGAMIAITKFGVPLMVVMVVLQWWGKRPREKLRQTTIVAGLTFLFALLIAQIILLFIHRIRPYDAGVSQLIIDKTIDWSFPSDHAIASLSIAFAFLLNGFRRQAIAFFCAAALVCFSRIFVGMHYASDILGGAGLALPTAYLLNTHYPRGSKLDLWLLHWF
jgi:undecaprenyl-diphosphatase